MRRSARRRWAAPPRSACSDEVGSLEVGKSCDLIVLGADTRHELPYHYGVNLVEGAFVGGGAGTSATGATARRKAAP